MIYGYIRVSTEKQTVENQRYVIKGYLKANKIKEEIQWVNETVSGTKSPKLRKLNTILGNVKEGDIIYVTEISRLGRSLLMVQNMVHDLIFKGVQIVAISENMVYKEYDLKTEVMTFAYALNYETERCNTSDRTKIALAKKRSEGVKIGRQKGYKPTNYKLTGKEELIYKRLIKKGQSKNSLAKELGVQWKTLDTFVKTNKRYKKYARSVA